MAYFGRGPATSCSWEASSTGLKVFLDHLSSPEEINARMMRLAISGCPNISFLANQASRSLLVAKPWHAVVTSKPQQRSSAALGRGHRTVSSMAHSGLHYEVFGKVLQCSSWLAGFFKHPRQLPVNIPTCTARGKRTPYILKGDLVQFRFRECSSERALLRKQKS